MLSIDPSSPFTEGALLGDRIRLSEHFLDEGVYIRSMASRGALGGLSEATLQAALLMDAAGKDDVLIETVGVGQAEIDIIDHADTIVLALMPGSGDSVQALKAGVMEIPDVIVVNKADHPLTDTMVREIRGVLALGPDGRLEGPDRRTEATEGSGIAELLEAIDAHHAHIEATGTLERAPRRATCATRCSGSPPCGCGASSRCGSPRTERSPACSTASCAARPIPRARQAGCSSAAAWAIPMAESDDTTELPPAGSGFDLADARECVGAKLEEVGGGNVGRVHGLLVDAVDGSPTWLVVKLGRIGRRAAVPASYVAGAAGRAWAAFPRSWIRGAAEIDPSRGLNAGRGAAARSPTTASRSRRGGRPRWPTGRRTSRARSPTPEDARAQPSTARRPRAGSSPSGSVASSGGGAGSGASSISSE